MSVLDSLRKQADAAGAPKAPPAPAAAAPAAATTLDPNEKFWVLGPDNAPAASTRGQIQARVDAGDADYLIVKDGEQDWKRPADYDIQKAAPPAPAAPPPPPAAAAAPQPPPPPAAQASAAPATPATPAAPAASQAPSQAPAVADQGHGYRALPSLVTDEAAALAAFQSIAGSDADLATIVDQVEGGAGMTHTFPFAQLKGEQWDVHKSCPQEISEFMPVGRRPFLGIYLCQRIAATGWKGGGTRGSGSPPLWHFALPYPTAHDRASELNERTLRVGREIQFTKADDKVRFDQLGRLTPEVHVLVWTPQTQFIVLVVPGYRSTVLTLELLKGKIQQFMTQPLRWEIETEVQENKRVAKENPDAKNARWEEHYLTSTFEPSDKCKELKKAWDEFYARDPVTAGNALLAFQHAADYQGLSVEEVADLLTRYEPLITQRRGGNGAK